MQYSSGWFAGSTGAAATAAAPAAQPNSCQLAGAFTPGGQAAADTTATSRHNQAVAMAAAMAVAAIAAGTDISVSDISRATAAAVSTMMSPQLAVAGTTHTPVASRRSHHAQQPSGSSGQPRCKLSNSAATALRDVPVHQWHSGVALQNFGSGVQCNGLHCTVKLRRGQVFLVICVKNGRGWALTPGSNQPHLVHGVPAAVFACSRSCAANLQPGCRPPPTCDIELHAGGCGRPVLLAGEAANQPAAAERVQQWLLDEGLCPMFTD